MLQLPRARPRLAGCSPYLAPVSTLKCVVPITDIGSWPLHSCINQEKAGLGQYLLQIAACWMKPEPEPSRRESTLTPRHIRVPTWLTIAVEEPTCDAFLALTLTALAASTLTMTIANPPFPFLLKAA